MIHNDPHGLPPGSLVLASRLLCAIFGECTAVSAASFVAIGGAGVQVRTHLNTIEFGGLAFYSLPAGVPTDGSCQLRIVALDGFNRFACPVGMGETSCCSGTFLGRLLMASARVLSVDAAFFGM